MNFNLERSILHDVIRYGEIFFNYNTIVSSAKRFSVNTQKSLSLYKQISYDIHSGLMALFYIVNDERSLIAYIFSRNLYAIDSIDDLIHCFDIDIFEKIKEFYFKEDTNFFDISNSWSNDLLQSFLYASLETDEMKQSLIFTIKDLYLRIQTLYSSREVHSIISQFKITKSCLKTLYTYCKHELDNESVYGVSILHPHTIKVSGYIPDEDNDNKRYFILGYLYKDILGKVDDVNISQDNIHAALSNPIDRDIIDLIWENGEMYGEEIIQMINQKYSLAAQSIYRHISYLQKCGPLVLTKTVQKAQYYQVNYTWFLNSHTYLSDYMIKYTERKIKK